MKREEVRGGEEEGRYREIERGRAHESQEVVVIVTESLYLSIRAISGISLLWKKAKKTTYQGQRAVSFRGNDLPTHMH